MLALIYFIILAVIALGAALCVFFSRHPLYGALSLVVTMLSLAGIYGLLSSPFLGAVQVMVYAGAVMMLLTFVIMVLNGAKDSKTPRFDKVSLFVFPAVIALASLLGVALISSPLSFSNETLRGSVEMASSALFDTSSGKGYFILFEAIGLLLLSAMGAATLMAKRRLGKESSEKEAT